MTSLIDSPGTALKFLRITTQLTLEQAATAACVNPEVLREVEQGGKAPSVEWIRAVAATLGAHLGEGR